MPINCVCAFGVIPASLHQVAAFCVLYFQIVRISSEFELRVFRT
jgi:hypothetical protein